jgi:peptidoglycan/LPS O-acetylase OafA/YrhL
MGRIKYLDGLRGIAALTVVLYHCLDFETPYYMIPKKWSTFFSIFLNGADAVHLFFVLSGVVLSYMCLNTSNDDVIEDYPKYLVKRFMRIFPLYWVNYFILIVIGGIPAILRGVFIRDCIFNRVHLVKEFFLIRGDHTFYIPGWSLEIEIALSILVPFLLVIGRKSLKVYHILIILVFFLSTIIPRQLFHFMLGTLITLNLDYLQKWDFHKSKVFAYRFLMIPILLFFFSLRQIDKLYSLKFVTTPLAEYLGITFENFSAIVSAIVIVWIIKSSFLQSFLESKLLQWLGKISYSLYLIHWFVLFALYREWLLPHIHDYLPSIRWHAVSTFTFVLSTSLLLATFLHYIIELRLNKIGKRIFNL